MKKIIDRLYYQFCYFFTVLSHLPPYGFLILLIIVPLIFMRLVTTSASPLDFLFKLLFISLAVIFSYKVFVLTFRFFSIRRKHEFNENIIRDKKSLRFLIKMMISQNVFSDLGERCNSEEHVTSGHTYSILHSVLLQKNEELHRAEDLQIKLVVCCLIALFVAGSNIYFLLLNVLLFLVTAFYVSYIYDKDDLYRNIMELTVEIYLLHKEKPALCRDMILQSPKEEIRQLWTVYREIIKMTDTNT